MIAKPLSISVSRHAVGKLEAIIKPMIRIEGVRRSLFLVALWTKTVDNDTSTLGVLIKPVLSLLIPSEIGGMS